MRTIPACWRALAAGAALALALSPALAAPAGPAAPEKDNAAANPVEKLRKDLDRPITIKIEKQPLSTAVEALHKQTGINIVLDSMTIQQQLGFTPDQPPVPVEVDAKDMKVRNVLRAIVQPYGLTYAPIGDVVVVTTEDVAMYRQMRQRISVDMEKVEFATALKQIGHDTAVNLILDTRAEKQGGTKVSLQLEDVPLETAVRLLAEMANLKPVRIGNVLFVTTKENANELRQDPDLAQPNPNLRAQEMLQQQQILQLQLGAQAGLGGIQVNPPGLAPGGFAGPPGVAPAVPPAAAPPASDAPKADKDTPDKPPAKDAPPPEESKPPAK